MSELLQFSARDFHVDEAIENNQSARVIVTQFGSAAEIFELNGDRCPCAQITAAPTLLPSTDYVLRFAVTHGLSEAKNEICRCIVVLDGDWAERYEFDLAQNRYQPIFCKADIDGGLLRVFEIPFKTTESAAVQILFSAQNCIMKICPPQDDAKYFALPDMSYANWFDTQMQKKQAAAAIPEVPKPVPQPESPVDALMRKLDKFAPPLPNQQQPKTMQKTPQEEQDEKLADFVCMYMKKQNLALNVEEAMRTFSISERQATKCMRILFDRNAVNYDLETRRYSVAE